MAFFKVIPILRLVAIKDESRGPFTSAEKIVDEMIAIIKASKNSSEAKEKLLAKTCSNQTNHDHASTANNIN